MKNNYYWLLIVLFAIISFLGFLDAVYLTAKHYLKTIPPCFIANGCTTVLTSQYSTIFDIPIALIGTLYYLTLFLITIFALKINKKFFNWSFFLTPIGFLISLILVYIQIFILQELCSYCIFSALASTILFILNLVILRLSSKKI